MKIKDNDYVYIKDDKVYRLINDVRKYDISDSVVALL
tara:strand:+ start:382 stop:492 length:111 start_codon:yes stop_codon:yes gene_type:complete